MQIHNNFGLVLIGMLVASNIRSGNRRDDGKAYVLRENTITTGKSTYKHMESLDPTVKDSHVERNLFENVSVDVERASTENGVTSVWGTVSVQNTDKEAKK